MNMDDNHHSFSLFERIRSIGYAGKGIIGFFRSEHNAIIYLIITIAVIALGLWLSVSVTEWIVLILAIGLVFSAEVFNTAIEKLADEISPDYSESIKKIKDLSAAAVLILAITSFIIGLIIFIPLVWNKLF
jgi:diacylglycerol kinase (ATP)